ncbi:MAG: hypothetical protein LBI36_05570 [Oscillospiraceae bacterium]|nr:hypothetical protein [Oscillospiraceae bacterium]
MKFKRLLSGALAAVTALALIPVTAVSAATAGRVNTYNVYVNVGKSVKIPYSGSVSFKSGKTSVASVSKGTVKGKKSDNVRITASFYQSSSSTTKSSTTLQAFVITSKTPVTKVATSSSSKNMLVGDKVQVTFDLTPAKHTDMINVFNSNPDVIELYSAGSSGYFNVTAVKTGSATVSVVASSGVKKDVKITVKKNGTDYTTQFGVQVPKKAQKAGKLSISDISLFKYRRDGEPTLNAAVKNNHTATVDYNTKVPIKYYDGDKKEIKVDEYSQSLSLYQAIAKGAKEEYGLGTTLPAGTKSFKFGTADIKPATQTPQQSAPTKTLKGTVSKGGIKFPKTTATVESSDEYDQAKIRFEKIEYKKGDYEGYVYIKNTSDKALSVPNFEMRGYDGSGKRIDGDAGHFYGYSTLLLPGQTLKSIMYVYGYRDNLKRIDFVVNTDFSADWREYTSVKGTVSVGGIKVPKKDSKITVESYGSTYKLSVSATPVYKKNKRDASTSWYYENYISFKLKVDSIAADTNYHYVDIPIQWFDGSYVVPDYPEDVYVYNENVVKNKVTTYDDVITNSRFLKADKVVFGNYGYDRVDFLSVKSG